MPGRIAIEPCEICGRETTPRTYYSFGASREIINYLASPQVTPNPDFFEIAICGTDLHLIHKIRREHPEAKPTQLVEAASNYRSQFPIESNR